MEISHDIAEKNMKEISWYNLEKFPSSNYECFIREETARSHVCLAGIDLLPAYHSQTCSFQQLCSPRTRVQQVVPGQAGLVEAYEP